MLLASQLLEDALEAVFGAIYLAGGFDACAKGIREICAPVINELPSAEELKAAKDVLNLEEHENGEHKIDSELVFDYENGH